MGVSRETAMHGVMERLQELIATSSMGVSKRDSQSWSGCPD